ncbi:unnamed protein product [Heligmosomoides polygyrus]|uniref:Reverse transcriptase domain-containing protein n=1 Tax=Heligmosomoides polygyrus TaxID=6339 RepID=A0A183G0I0_HELPZ|nr:unnamed protein product [Heligmosomoides polygyrus]
MLYGTRCENMVFLKFSFHQLFQLVGQDCSISTATRFIFEAEICGLKFTEPLAHSAFPSTIRPRHLIDLFAVLRQHGVPEELIEWVRILYSCPRSRVRAPAGTSMEFPFSVGVHQGSALSPLLFVIVMDAISRDLQMVARWTLLYADDAMLACEDKTELERQAQAWHCSVSSQTSKRQTT